MRTSPAIISLAVIAGTIAIPVTFESRSLLSDAFESIEAEGKKGFDQIFKEGVIGGTAAGAAKSTTSNVVNRRDIRARSLLSDAIKSIEAEGKKGFGQIVKEGIIGGTAAGAAKSTTSNVVNRRDIRARSLLSDAIETIEATGKKGFDQIIKEGIIGGTAAGAAKATTSNVVNRRNIRDKSTEEDRRVRFENLLPIFDGTAQVGSKRCTQIGDSIGCLFDPVETPNFNGPFIKARAPNEHVDGPFIRGFTGIDGHIPSVQELFSPSFERNPLNHQISIRGFTGIDGHIPSVQELFSPSFERNPLNHQISIRRALESKRCTQIGDSIGCLFDPVDPIFNGPFIKERAPASDSIDDLDGPLPVGPLTVGHHDGFGGSPDLDGPEQAHHIRDLDGPLSVGHHDGFGGSDGPEQAHHIRDLDGPLSLGHHDGFGGSPDFDGPEQAHHIRDLDGPLSLGHHDGFGGSPDFDGPEQAHHIREFGRAVELAYQEMKREPFALIPGFGGEPEFFDEPFFKGGPVAREPEPFAIIPGSGPDKGKIEFFNRPGPGGPVALRDLTVSEFANLIQRALDIDEVD